MENVALQKIAQRLTQLGSIYCNLSMDDFAVLLFKKSLGSFPTPEAYIGLVHYTTPMYVAKLVGPTIALAFFITFSRPHQ